MEKLLLRKIVFLFSENGRKRQRSPPDQREEEKEAERQECCRFKVRKRKCPGLLCYVLVAIQPNLISLQIEGHQSEIINNVDQLLHYIEGTKENNMKTRPVQSKSKQLHKQHASEDGGSKAGKKRHPKSGVKESGSNVALDGRHELKVSVSVNKSRFK